MWTMELEIHYGLSQNSPSSLFTAWAEILNLDVIDIWTRLFFIVGGYPVRFRMFRSIRGLCPLNVTSKPLLLLKQPSFQVLPNVSSGAKSLLVGNQWNTVLKNLTFFLQLRLHFHNPLWVAVFRFNIPCQITCNYSQKLPQR